MQDEQLKKILMGRGNWHVCVLEGHGEELKKVS